MQRFIVFLRPFGHPDLLTIAVGRDGGAETGPLEGSWKGISFLNPEHDGAVLPVLHLNGGKIAAPTVLSRKPPADFGVRKGKIVHNRT